MMDTRMLGKVWLGLLGVVWGFYPVYSAPSADTESVAHAFEAAVYRVEGTYDYPGFQLMQIHLPVLSHYSYCVASDGQALLVDPGRDIAFYLDLIREHGLKVVGVYLTGTHADFVAGHMELIQALRCPIYQSNGSRAEYHIRATTDGDTFNVGQATVRTLATPGHVPDGISALIYSPGKNTPAVMLSGDYLFVGSVGLPDRVEGTTAATLAGLIYDTWVNKVAQLPDSVQVFPGHGTGSPWGISHRDAPVTTIGTDRTTNPFLQHTAKGAFITKVLSSLSEPPAYFAHNAALNRVGPPLVAWDQPLDRVTAEVTLMEPQQTLVVDIRDANAYASGHIPNAVNIGLHGHFETWVGTVVPWDAKLVLCGDDAELTEAVTRLHRVGYEAQVLRFADWRDAGLALKQNQRMSPGDLQAALRSGVAPVIVDVRRPDEYAGLRIGTVLNLPLRQLTHLSALLNPNEPLIVVGNSDYRSSLAIGLLERQGFGQITSLAGGTDAWIAAGYPVAGPPTPAPESQDPAPSATPQRVRPLPERIAAVELSRLLMDLPETFDLVDIRGPVHFADYHLPGATRVDVTVLLTDSAYRTGIKPLIVVDRDGSLAMAVAGILSQRSERPIKALYGGLEAYWSAIHLDVPPVTPAAPLPTTKTTQPATTNTGY